MKKYLLFAAILGSSIAHSQFWYFGGRCGLDFSSGSPVAVTNGQMTATEGCITINDATGNLLFYSNGDSIWDRNHNWMPNSVGPGFGGYSCSQSTMAIRKPGNPNIYYMFYQAAQGGPNGFRYVEIDMTLNSGFGDVSSTPAVQLLSQSCEQMTAIRHANGIDSWVIVHGLNSNSFYAYLVNGAGVSNTPVVSSVGTTINASFNMVETIGCMKISCNGQHLAIAHYGDSITELFNFDRSTGAISNPQVLSTSYAPYGVEFSSNSSYLYVSEWSWNNAAIYQYDLTATNIAASQTVIGNVPASLGAAGALQMGPDHKIYIAVLFSDSISVIQNPDNAGVACNFLANGVYLGQYAQSLYGLPNVQCGLYCIPPNPDGVEETTANDSISVYPNPVMDFFVVDGSKLNNNYTVELINITGQIIYSTSFTCGTTNRVSCANLNAGMYYIVIHYGTIVTKKKLILQHE